MPQAEMFGATASYATLDCPVAARKKLLAAFCLEGSLDHMIAELHP